MNRPASEDPPTSTDRAGAEAELDQKFAELEQREAALAARTPFWLSHHTPDEYARTFRLGSLHVCARCLGTYPVLALALAAQLATSAPLSWKFDGAWSVGLLLPALVDWAIGRFRPRGGNNLIRTVSGALLGLALGRTLYVHLHSPLPRWLLVQAGLVTAVAAPVILARWLGGADRSFSAAVRSDGVRRAPKKGERWNRK